MMKIQDRLKGKLKISILVWNLSTNDGFIRASLLQKALEKLGHKTEILGFVFNKNLYSAIPQETPLFYLEGGNYPEFLLNAGKLLQHIDGDIIYAIKPQPASFGIALLNKLYSRKPIILDIDDWEMSWYGGDEWVYQPTFKQLARDIIKPDGALRVPHHPLYIKWMEKLINQANAVTIHNEFLQQRFGGVYVPNGKDIDLFNPNKYKPEESRKRYGLSGYRILMFPGAPRPYKGLEDVLIALDKINEADLKLVIVGGSPYDNYDAELQQKWGKWIIQLPQYPADVMPDVIAAAHLVVVPQRNTTTTIAQFPLKLTDGMAMSKPVLATKVGDIPTILDETGYLVDPNCPEKIAEKIKYIFANWQEAEEKGQKARARCIAQYSLDTMASTLNQLISRL